MSPSVKVGDKIELVTAPITTRQLVQYAGASGDFNRIHYDEPFARAAGFETVIAHGMLSMAFFGQLVADVAGPQHVRSLKARFRAVTYPGDVIRVSGEVVEVSDTADGGKMYGIKLSAARPDGTIALEGHAILS